MMNRKYDILCIGTSLVDIIIKGFDPEPASASGYRAASCTINPGGEALNGAIAAAKLGMRTAVLGHVGTDAAGGIVKEELKKNGVDTELVVTDEHPTPVTTMFVNGDGTRKSITTEAHRYSFHPEKYAGCFGQTSAVILGSLFRAPFDDPDVIQAVAETAKKNAVRIFADTKLSNFRALTLKDLARSLPLMDYITPNEDEARHYTGKEQPEEMADVFLTAGVKNVIIKLGSKGCFFKNAETQISLPALPVKAVDATGAGDNFVAGFASEILRGSSIGSALCFANACGAICSTAVGAGAALKNREQVLAVLEEMYI